MPLVRYLFLGNATYPNLAVSRYVASGNKLNDEGLSPYELQVMKEHRDAVKNGPDLLSPAEWCATDADLLELATKPVSEGGDPSKYQPTPQVTAFLGRNLSRIDKFIQYCNLELAQDWRSQASQIASVPYSVIESMPQREQLRHVDSAWTAFGNIFRALNVRPYGWAKYRRIWEWAIDPSDNRGAPIRASLRLPPREKVYVGVNDAMGALSAWRRDLAVTYNRGNPRYALPTGQNRCALVSIGTKDAVDLAWDTSNDPACLSRLQTTSDSCWGPTVDKFFVWMGNDAKVAIPTSFIPDVFRALPVAQRLAEGAKWSGSAQQFDDYYDDDTTGRIFATAPLKWYMDVLRSLLDDLRDKDLLALIHEIRTDIIGKNRWTLGVTNKTVPEIMVGSDNLVVESQRSDMSDRNRIISYLGPAAALVAVANPIAGAAVGLAIGIAALVANVVPAKTISLPRDVFGRPTPTMEVFWINEVAAVEDRGRAAESMPPRVAERVSITQMPVGGRLWINGIDVTDYSDPSHPAARWVDAARTVREFPMPAAESRINSIRVVDAAGISRDAEIGGPNGFRITDGVAHVGYADFLPAKAIVRILQPHASLSIDGLPLPRTDAVNAAGTEFRYEVPSGMAGTPPVPRVLTVTGLQGETWEFLLAIPAGQMQMIVLSPAALKTPALPPPPPREVVEATRQGVVVLGIPMFSVVFLDGATQGNVGGEVIGTAPNLLWFVPATVGTHRLRIVALDQSVREGTVTIARHRIASVSWGDLRVTTPAATEQGTLTVTGPVGWRLALALVGSSVPFVATDLTAGGPSISAWPVGQYTLGVDDLHGRIAAATITLTATGLAVDAEEFLAAHTGWLTINGPAGWLLAIGPVGATKPTLAANMPAEGSVSVPWPVGDWALGIDDGAGRRAVKTITIRQGTTPLVIDARAFVAPPVTPPIQQHQVMADDGKESNTMVYLAGAVALGAVALFVGTTMLGTPVTVKARQNPARRRGRR